MIGIIRDRVGQIGERGEYWMGMRMSGMIWNSELQCGSPRLCQLRIDRLAPMSKFELCTGVYRILWGLTNWVALCAAESEAILPYLTGVKWNSACATHGVFIEAYVWNTCTRVNCCHPWCPFDPRVSCCQVNTLTRLTIDSNLHDYPQIWVTLARCSHSEELSTS
jgi:hypothetical protein